MAETIVFRHKTPVQIRYTDIDMMSHVTNSVYLSYCDIARMEYFIQVLDEQIEQKEESLVVASVTIDFIQSIFLYEKIEVCTKVQLIGNKSIQMLQHIINAETLEIKAVVKTIISGYNYLNHHSILLAERWKRRIAEFEKDVAFKYKE